jgi:pimeloyl-ACP methyl ester carboxylesterase
MILHATEHGAGAPILLLHGLYGAAQNLGMIARALPDYRVIALDARNHGASPHAPDMGYDTLARDVLETMDALHIGAAALIGHSMGGKTAMMVSLLAPARVRALAVLDIAPLIYDHAETRAELVDAMAALKLTPGLTRQQANADLAAAIPDAALRSFLLNNLRLSHADTPSWRLDLAAIRAALPTLTGWVDPVPLVPYAGPSLFLRGANSAYVPLDAQPDAMMAIHRRFPGAVIETIAQAGHWLHAEQPHAVNQALHRFLASAEYPCAQPSARLNPSP